MFIDYNNLDIGRAVYAPYFFELIFISDSKLVHYLLPNMWFVLSQSWIFQENMLKTPNQLISNTTANE